MTKVGKKKRRIILIVLCAVIVLAGAGAGILVWENRVERQFPMWRTPCIEPDERDINPDISLRFSGIDFEVSLSSGHVYDRVLMKAKNNSGSGISGGNLAWIDYQNEGEWHTVWRGVQTLATVIYDGPKTDDGEMLIDQYVPAGLFARDGQYRLFKDGLGYCDIDIIGINSMK